MKNYKLLVGITIGLFLGLVLGYFYFKAPSSETMLLKEANEMNRVCPVMIDETVRLDNVVVLEGVKFQYNYTLLDVEKEEIEAGDFADQMLLSARKEVRQNPELKVFRDKKTTFIHHYKDKNGETITKVAISPEDYKD